MNWWWGECPYSTKTREVLGNPSPPPSRFPSTLEISLGLRPREISRVSGNLLGVGDGFPNTSLVLVEHWYICWTIFRSERPVSPIFSPYIMSNKTYERKEKIASQLCKSSSKFITTGIILTAAKSWPGKNLIFKSKQVTIRWLIWFKLSNIFETLKLVNINVWIPSKLL